LPCPAPRTTLSTQRLDQRARRGRSLRRGALNEAAAQHARLTRRRIVEHAGLARRDALLARDELHLVMAGRAAQPGRLWRARRAHAYENLEPLADRIVKRTVADPVDIAQHDAIHSQRLARTDHDAAARSIQSHDIERAACGNAQSLALAHREMGNPLVLT